MKKIVSIALALTLAMALTLSVCAATYEGSVVINAKGWWAIVDSDNYDFFGEIGKENAESITFSCADHNIIVCYKDAEGNWIQSDGSENEFTVNFADVGTGEHFYVCVVISDDDGVDYTVNYTVEGEIVEATVEEPAVEEPEEEKPAETGLALAAVPAVIALAVTVLSKKR